jgi:hypothetical protein
MESDTDNSSGNSATKSRQQHILESSIEITYNSMMVY